MARAAIKKSSKKRGAASSRKTGRGGARKGPAAKKGAPQKRSASKGRRRQTKGSAEWAGAFQTLLGSSQGREIMADMLDAVSATLRKQRETAIRAGEAGTEAVAGAVETTLDAATEMHRERWASLSARRPFSRTSSLKRCGRSWRACQVGQRGQQRHEVGSVLRVSEASDRPLALSSDAGWSGLTVGGAGGLAGELGNNGKSGNEALPFSL